MSKKTTDGNDYTKRLETLEHKKWKRMLDVQAPYRWNLNRLDMGKTLDVGCGIGRNLKNLPDGSVGVDHNAHSISVVNEMGFEAYTSKDFHKKHKKTKIYDSMLLAHVLEHMTPKEGVNILKEYLPYLKPKAKVVVICPQEVGYRSDDTHVTFLDTHDIEKIMKEAGITHVKSYSFPFIRTAGKVFKYNESVVVGNV